MAKKAAEGAPAWIATFADLMSLLLTLFVLLLTFAEMDVVKYKAIAGSVENAFGTSRIDKMTGVIELEGSVLRKHATELDPTELDVVEEDIPAVSVDIPVISEEELEKKAQEVREEKAEELKEELASTMQTEIDVDGISVERIGEDVVLRFPSEIAFPIGSNTLNTEFEALLDRLAPILEKTPGELVVSGHTDNLPVRSGFYQSNWDLSASRATAVVHRFLFEHLIDPARITVQGYGDSRPIASNDTFEGRRQNRRVEISIIRSTGQEVLKAKPETKSEAVAPDFYE